MTHQNENILHCVFLQTKQTSAAHLSFLCILLHFLWNSGRKAEKRSVFRRIRSGDIAAELDRETSSLGPVRSSLIVKGMIWSPTHGDTAFTVPLFDEFMKRIVPGKDWAKIEA